MQGIKAVKPKAMMLEKEIRTMTLSGADTSKLNPMIDRLAELKAQVSKVHVKCIHDSKNILTKKQVQFLLN